MNLGNGSIQLTNLSHVGFAVKDADKTVEFLSSIWNLGPPESVIYEPRPEDMFVGEAFSLKVVFVKFGPVQLELLQPLDDKSVWSKFIAEKGEGIHHVAYGISNYDEVIEKMEEQKHTLLVSAIYQGYRWCYYATSPGGMVIEFREEYARGK